MKFKCTSLNGVKELNIDIFLKKSTEYIMNENLWENVE